MKERKTTERKKKERTAEIQKGRKEVGEIGMKLAIADVCISAYISALCTV